MKLKQTSNLSAVHAAKAVKTMNGKRTTITSLLTLAGMISVLFAAGVTHAHGPEPVKTQYLSQKRSLRIVHTNELKQMHADYRASMSQAAADRRAALRVCEPQRTWLLDRIKVARSQAGECYRADLAVARKGYRLAVAELDLWYAAAKHRHGHSHVEIVTTAPQYVIESTTTYSVPAASTIETTVVGPEFPTTEYELIEPQIIEGPFGEGSVLEEHELMIEGPSLNGPIIEGPIIEGPIIEGPIIEGPVNGIPTSPSQEPTPAVEFLPTPSLGSHTIGDGHTHGKHVTIGHEHEHVTDQRPVSAKRARRAILGRLVSSALDALAE